MNRFRKKICAVFFALAFCGNALFAAVGCDLNDPDRDVKRFFPQSTGYRTDYVSVEKLGGNALYEKLEAELGDKFNGVFEKIDVPYTVYTVLAGTRTLGYIHGVNQKGKFGGMQVFLIFDGQGAIRKFYFQKLTSKGARALRSDEFGEQFVGLTLDDFRAYDVPARSAPEGSKVARIKNPVEDGSCDDDFYAALRGTKKNLVLMNAFVFGARKNETEGQ